MRCCCRRRGLTLKRRERLSRIDSLVSVGREIMSLYPYPVVLAKYSSTDPSLPRGRSHGTKSLTMAAKALWQPLL